MGGGKIVKPLEVIRDVRVRADVEALQKVAEDLARMPPFELFKIGDVDGPPPGFEIPIGNYPSQGDTGRDRIEIFRDGPPEWLRTPDKKKRPGGSRQDQPIMILVQDLFDIPANIIAGALPWLTTPAKDERVMLNAEDDGGDTSLPPSAIADEPTPQGPRMNLPALPEGRLVGLSLIAPSNSFVKRIMAGIFASAIGGRARPFIFRMAGMSVSYDPKTDQPLPGTVGKKITIQISINDPEPGEDARELRNRMNNTANFYNLLVAATKEAPPHLSVNIEVTAADVGRFIDDVIRLYDEGQKEIDEMRMAACKLLTGETDPQKIYTALKAATITMRDVDSILIPIHVKNAEFIALVATLTEMLKDTENSYQNLLEVAAGFTVAYEDHGILGLQRMLAGLTGMFRKGVGRIHERIVDLRERVHDARNPLTAMQGGEEFLRADTTDGLPQNLTRYLPSRNVFATIKSVVATIAKEGEKAGVLVRYSRGTENLKDRQFDPVRLKLLGRAIAEQLNNSVKYRREMPPGEKSMAEAHAEISSDGLNLITTVTDNGIGMTPDELANFREVEGWRAEGAAATSGTANQGTGSKDITHIVEDQLGGKLLVESTKNVGTKITSIIPLSNLTEAPSTP